MPEKSSASSTGYRFIIWECNTSTHRRCRLVRSDGIRSIYKNYKPHTHYIVR